jgi:molybdenum cofactor cytidylyltransferase
MGTGIVILAAGNSSRMGQAKQLLTYQGLTLLERVVDAAMQSCFRPVVLVLGAYAEEISELRLPDGIIRTINPNWQEGMASSICTGMATILDQQPQIDNVIIAVADQVFITAEVFAALLKKKQQTGKNIIASSYAKTRGTPVMFDRKYFDLLMSLKGKEGAKIILKQHAGDIEAVAFELGHIDIDTKKDYSDLLIFEEKV